MKDNTPGCPTEQPAMGKLKIKGPAGMHDPRFAKMYTDPRFQRFPKKKAKVEIDSRFASMFSDPDFAVRSQVVDKRGRLLGEGGRARKADEAIKRYYCLKNDGVDVVEQREWQQDLQQHKPEQLQQPDRLKKAIGKQQQQRQQDVQTNLKQGRQTLVAKRQDVSSSEELESDDDTPSSSSGGGSAGAGCNADKGHAGSSGDEDVTGGSSDDAGAAGASDDALDEDKKAQRRWARARGLIDMSSTSDEDGSIGLDDNSNAEQERQKGNAADGSDVEHNLLDSSDWGSEDSDAAASSSDGDDAGSRNAAAAALAEWGVGALATNPNEHIPRSEETSRLAVVDLDWANITATDILAVMRSFDPTGGSAVLRVTVYPSDYGLEKMAEEQDMGPQALWAKPAAQQQGGDEPSDSTGLSGSDKAAAFNSGNGSGSGSDAGEGQDSGKLYSSSDQSDAADDSDDTDTKKERPDSKGRNSKSWQQQQHNKQQHTAWQKQAAKRSSGSKAAAAAAGSGSNKSNDAAADQSDIGEGAGLDPERVLMYERSKLRWYYAVVECDSVATAAKLYESCDGLEFERSASKFDLRFLPGDMDLSQRVVRDAASQVPAGYSPPDLFSGALQHTDPRLTWDEGDKRRKKVLTRKVAEDELKDDDFAAYLATSSGTEEGDGTDKADKQSQDGQEGEEPHRAATAAQAHGSAKQQQQQQRQQPGDGNKRKGEAAGDDDAEVLRARYRALLLGDTAVERAGGKSWGAAAATTDGADSVSTGPSSEDEGYTFRAVESGGKPKQKKEREAPGMTVTFVSGLEKLGSKLLEKKREDEAKKRDTVWEAYLRRQAEKRKARKAAGRKGSGSSSDDNTDDGMGGRGRKRHQHDRQPAGAAGGSGVVGRGNADDPFSDPFFQDDAEFPHDLEAATADSDDEGNRPSTAGSKQQPETQRQRQQGAGNGSVKSKKQEQQQQKAAAAKQAAELELLLMDDAGLRDAARGVTAPGLATAAATGVSNGAGKKGTSGKLSKKERQRILAEKKRARRATGGGSGDEQEAAGVRGGQFKVNLDDSRFTAMYQDQAFALDPTDPKYSKTQGIEQLVTAVNTKRQNLGKQRQQQDFAGDARNGVAAVVAATSGTAGSASSGGAKRPELKHIVAKLKRKQQQQQYQQSKQQQSKSRKLA